MTQHEVEQMKRIEELLGWVVVLLSRLPESARGKNFSGNNIDPISSKANAIGWNAIERCGDRIQKEEVRRIARRLS